MALAVVINGQRRVFEQLSEECFMDQVVEELGLKGDRVAVEKNGEIVPRTEWATTPVVDEDKLEVVHFVGGGSEIGCNGI